MPMDEQKSYMLNFISQIYIKFEDYDSKLYQNLDDMEA